MFQKKIFDRSLCCKRFGASPSKKLESGWKKKQTDKQANEHNRYTQAALFVYRRPRHDINSSRAGFASCLSAFLTRPLWNPVIKHCIRPLISGHKNVAAGIES